MASDQSTKKFYVPRDWSLGQRLRCRTAEPDQNGCAIWIGARHISGYGQLRWENQMQPAHRLAWQMKHGPIPRGLVICHHCDNPPCVNVDHLFIGTRGDNNHDRTVKGRTAHPKGEKNGRAKLTEAEILAIRNDPRKQYVIAREYGVTKSTVSAIILRKRWNHAA